MANSTRFYYNTRYILPIMIGIIVGFGLSLLCTPFYYCENSSFNFRIFRSANMSLSELVNVQKQQYKLYLQKQFQLDDFEPRINLEGKRKTKVNLNVLIHFNLTRKYDHSKVKSNFSDIT